MKYISIIILFISFSACKAQDKPQQQTASEKKSDYVKLNVVTVIDNRDLDGCKFMLMKEDSSMLNPLNLADSLQVSGLRLGVTYHEIRNAVSVCMAGKAIELDIIKKLDE